MWALGLLFLAAAAAASASVPESFPDPARIPPGRPFLRLAPAIAELSGMAWDPRESVIWSLSDSADRPDEIRELLGRTDPRSGRTEVIYVDGVTNRDWEALTISPVTGNLWIGEVGDNLAMYSSVRAHEVDPRDIRRDAEGRLRVAVTRTIEFRYPDGPMDVEAMVALEDETLLLIEKDYGGDSQVRRIDLSRRAPLQQTARRHARIAPRGPITDAALGPDGVIYLLTYTGVFECSSCREGGAGLQPLPAVSPGFRGQSEALISFGNGVFVVGREADGALFYW